MWRCGSKGTRYIPELLTILLELDKGSLAREKQGASVRSDLVSKGQLVLSFQP